MQDLEETIHMMLKTICYMKNCIIEIDNDSDMTYHEKHLALTQRRKWLVETQRQTLVLIEEFLETPRKVS